MSSTDFLLKGVDGQAKPHICTWRIQGLCPQDESPVEQAATGGAARRRWATSPVGWLRGCGRDTAGTMVVQDQMVSPVHLLPPTGEVMGGLQQPLRIRTPLCLALGKLLHPPHIQLRWRPHSTQSRKLLRHLPRYFISLKELRFRRIRDQNMIWPL